MLPEARRAGFARPAAAAALGIALLACGAPAATASAETRAAAHAAAGGETGGTGGAGAPEGPRQPAGGSPPGTPPAPQPPPAPPGRRAFPVGITVFTAVDPSRRIRLPGRGSERRRLQIVLRYPAAAPARGVDVRGAAPARAGGPYPLIVFAHGFAVTPATYARLLRGWARAGFVVAAPVFPLESAGAPGGPDESDLVNEPADISLVISTLLGASTPGSPAASVAGLIDSHRIAVAGQSDGGEAALATAYSRDAGDRRIGAAIVLSGAEMGGVGGYDFRRGEVPLLAVQGTADPINEPQYTYAYFQAARRPKYLLRLLGAQHLPPYTGEQPQLEIVERSSIDFLDAYLSHRARALARLRAQANVPHVAALTAEP